MLSSSQAASRVYPRACGGTACVAMVQTLRRGLSPRVRGNRHARPRAAKAWGSIPARAGEPASGRQAEGRGGSIPARAGEPVGQGLSGPQCRVYRRHLPFAADPAAAALRRVAESSFSSARGFIVVFHVFGANAADTERFPIVRMLHVVDAPNLLRLAHLADGIGSSEVVNRYAGPSLVWHSDLAPFSGHGFGPTSLSLFVRPTYALPRPNIEI